MAVICVDEHVKLGWRNGANEIRNKVTISVLILIYPQVTEPKGSLPCSQYPATGPYPKIDESAPHTHTLNISPPSKLVLSYRLFPLCFRRKLCMDFFFWVEFTRRGKLREPLWVRLIISM
jgi:hypothetical protein